MAIKNQKNGYLTGCLLQENTAVCSSGYGGTYGGDTTSTDASGEATPLPETTVTPSG